MQVVCYLVYRGCGDTKLTSPVPFHQPQDTKDIYVAIKTLRKRFPEAPVFAAGFSLGAYTLNKYVGEADSGVFASGAILQLLGGCIAASAWTDCMQSVAVQLTDVLGFDLPIGMLPWTSVERPHAFALHLIPGGISPDLCRDPAEMNATVSA
ncbi:hypothetical protein MMC29_007643 [Sticta canariensis]|nr:hypothetical protein [Sticta canariensis]